MFNRGRFDQRLARRVGGAVLLSLGLASWAAARAQTYEVLAQLTSRGGNPWGPLLQSGSGFSGTSFEGGAFGQGSIFLLTPDGNGGYASTDLHSFSGPDGISPASGLTPSPDGALYGSTYAGGAAGAGTVFRLDACGTFESLHDFATRDQFVIPGPLVFAYGNVYGATPLGEFFRIDPAGSFAVLQTIANSVRGGLALGADGAFYGTTYVGGAHNQGSVFRVDAGGNLTTLHSFDLADGEWPAAPLIQASDGYLYGTTSAGGVHGAGTVFRLDLSGGSFLKLHDLDYPEGAQVLAALLEASDGFLYGEADLGGDAGKGSFFRIDGAGNFEKLSSFDSWVHASSLIEGADGFFYGNELASIGGPDQHFIPGRAVRRDATGQATAVYTFLGRDPQNPYSSLVLASDGNLYGTSVGGGTHGVGAVFRIDPSGTLTTLHSFDGSDGESPQAALVQASDGFLYGTTYEGGVSVYGTVFRIDLDGNFTLLHSFLFTDGATPVAPLIEASDGFLYGTTYSGGNGRGTIFRVDGSGAVTPVYALQDADGWNPGGALVQASDGDFYGTTTSGGPTSSGTAFRVDASTFAFTTIHDFDGSDGGAPEGALLEGSDGKLYGTTSTSGMNGAGTVFRMDLSGNLSTLHHFATGAQSTAGLLLASDGLYYGTTVSGGGGNFGSVFRIDAQGSFETVHDFQSEDGQNPSSALIQASDGTLYGTTPGGGVAAGGVVYRILPDALAPTLASSSPASGWPLGGVAMTISGQHFRTGALISFGGIAAPAALVEDQSTIVATTPSLTPGYYYDLTVEDPSGVAALPDAFFADFLDVPCTHPFHDYIQTIAGELITAGCGNGAYCPEDPVTRGEMSVFLLKALLGPKYVPPPASGIFDDVPADYFARDWVEDLYVRGITGGCNPSPPPLLFCPDRAVTRAEMAVFLLKTLLGPSYVPPPAGGIFDDVPPGSFAIDWIEDLYARHITSGCSADPLLYCPNQANTRGQMAVFLVRTFGLPSSP